MDLTQLKVRLDRRWGAPCGLDVIGTRHKRRVVHKGNGLAKEGHEGTSKARAQALEVSAPAKAAEA